MAGYPICSRMSTGPFDVAQGETFFLPELVEGVLAALVDNSARHLWHC